MVATWAWKGVAHGVTPRDAMGSSGVAWLPADISDKISVLPPLGRRHLPALAPACTTSRTLLALLPPSRIARRQNRLLPLDGIPVRCRYHSRLSPDVRCGTQADEPDGADRTYHLSKRTPATCRFLFDWVSPDVPGLVWCGNITYA